MCSTQSVELRRRVNTGLDKGEARNGLARRLLLRAGRTAGSKRRTVAIPGQRSYPRHRRHRPLEYHPSRTSGLRSSKERTDHRSRTVQVPLPARLGAHPPDRRLSMAGQEARQRQIPDASILRPPSACFDVGFLRGPQDPHSQSPIVRFEVKQIQFMCSPEKQVFLQRLPAYRKM